MVLKKKIPVIILFLLLLLSILCKLRKEETKITTENGIEVLINPGEPYKKNRKESFTLHRRFSIDTQKGEIQNKGITDILGFEVDSSGEIYILNRIDPRSNLIYKFDKDGNFIKSFGGFGQGPGEVQNPFYISLDSKENLLISDLARHMVVVFDREGKFKNNIVLKKGGMLASSGPAGNLLVVAESAIAETGKQVFSLKLVDEHLNDLAIIDNYSLEWPKTSQFRAVPPLFCWTSSSDYIYVAKEDSGYEICVYDLQGKLIRKIRKKYRKVPVSEEYKTKILESFPEKLRSFAIFPDFHPPFQSLVAGNDGMLLVYTFEKGNNPGEFIVDIFNQSGRLVDRMSFNIFIREGFLWARIKSNKLYYLKEKEGGYKELVVSDINWSQ